MDALKVLQILTVPAVMKEHISLTEIVEPAHPFTLEMLLIGPVKNVTQCVLKDQGQKLYVLIVAMKPPDYTYNRIPMRIRLLC